MRLILLVLLSHICSFSFGRYYDGCFLDSSDLKVILEANSVTIYYLDDAFGEDGKVKSSKYIMNLRVVRQKKVSKTQIKNLRFALLNCNAYSTLLNKCSFLPLYCVKFTLNRNDLLLFFSKLDFCDGQIQVVKKGSDKETSVTFKDQQFKGIF